MPASCQLQHLILLWEYSYEYHLQQNTFPSLKELLLQLFLINHAFQPPASPLAPLSCVLPSACALCRAGCQGLGAGLLLRVPQCRAERNNCFQCLLDCPRMTFAFIPTVSHCWFMLISCFSLSAGPVCTAAQSISPACPSGHPGFPSWMPPSTFISLSSTLLISGLFYFILWGLLWITVLSVKVLLRPLQPHSVENLTEDMIYYFYSIPLPTSLVNQPEKESVFTNPHWLFPFPLLSSESYRLVV